MLTERSKLHKVNQEAYAILIERLLRWPSDVAKLAEVSGLSDLTTRDLMRVFKRRGVVWIVGWRKDSRGRDVWPVFALKIKGTEVDVEPHRKTGAERQAKYRAKNGKL